MVSKNRLLLWKINTQYQLIYCSQRLVAWSSTAEAEAPPSTLCGLSIYYFVSVRASNAVQFPRQYCCYSSVSGTTSTLKPRKEGHWYR